MIKYLLMALCLLAAGCTTIHFDNGDTTGVAAKTVTEQWHHNVALALVEVSDPVDLKKECGAGEWSSVKTELSFVAGLAGAVVDLIAPLWYPKNVEVTCK